jgi:hypothetical protein
MDADLRVGWIHWQGAVRAAWGQVLFDNPVRILRSLVLIFHSLRRDGFFFRGLVGLSGSYGCRGRNHKDVLAVLAANFLAADGIRPLASVAAIRAGNVDRSHEFKISQRLWKQMQEL